MIISEPILIPNKTDVLIYAVEINDRHGVGILVQRIFPNLDQMISIRALDIYNGEHKFGGVQLQISHTDLNRSKGIAKVKEALAAYNIDRVICIPYNSDEILTALAIHDLYGGSICTYVMDDRNVLIPGIPDELMQELLSKSDLCLGISPEMCDIYRAKYGIEMHFAPPVLPKELINNEIPNLSPEKLKSRTGAMIGNIWSSSWLEMLRQTTKVAKIDLDWYGNTGAEWNIEARSQLQGDGIIEKGFLPTELEVATALRQYPFVVVPSGTLDERDRKPSTSWLSLPSRIPFILASSNTPIIVLGNRHTAAARFVTRLGIGIVADYDGASLRRAVEYITQPEIQEQFRTRAASIAPLFENKDTNEWIWQSLAAGKPIDDRFDRILTQPLDYTQSLAQCFYAIRNYRDLQQLTGANSEQVTLLQQQVYELEAQIHSMESTKFWQLRQVWFKLKKLLRFI
jgi:hypothetical protein